MIEPRLSGPGRFETLADDRDRFHLRQSSLTEKTLLGYMLTCLVLAATLLVIGAQLIYEPRSTWLVFLVMPAGALWLLRYNGEVIADRQRRVVHVKVRQLGFWEGAKTFAFEEITGVAAIGAGRTARVEVRTGGLATVIADGIHAGAARRLATKLARLKDLEATLEGTWGQVEDDEEDKAPVAPVRSEHSTIVEEPLPTGFRVTYPTRSYGTATVLFFFSTFFGAVAIAFLSWALRHLYQGPVNFSRVMLVMTPSALLGLCGMLFYSGVCLTIGSERITVEDGHLEARTLLAGWRAGYLSVALEELKEVRVTGGIKLLWEGGARHVASTLPPSDQEWLCARIRAFLPQK